MPYSVGNVSGYRCNMAGDMLLKGLILLLCLAGAGCKPYRPWAQQESVHRVAFRR